MWSDSSRIFSPPSRRSLLTVGASVAALCSGCVVKTADPPTGDLTPTVDNTAAGDLDTAKSPPLVKASEIPAGGGIVIADKKIVVTRDINGDFHGFSAVCTHAGCIVATVGNGTIDCSCHGSKFDIATGKPVAGPARSPLPPVGVHQRGNYITVK
ncbi:Rieske (2Fe-2S) protein [Streptomyces chartreusis]|uniref:Rieske (2Fe-2S) protein n=1 Tax=Streptomyces chartreusis TaxID=1969 RepID=UPI00380E52A6